MEKSIMEKSTQDCDLYPNHGKGYTTEELEYICTYWHCDSRLDIGYAVGRKPKALSKLVQTLKEKKVFDKYDLNSEERKMLDAKKAKDNKVKPFDVVAVRKRLHILRKIKAHEGLTIEEIAFYMGATKKIVKNIFLILAIRGRGDIESITLSQSQIDEIICLRFPAWRPWVIG